EYAQLAGVQRQGYEVGGLIEHRLLRRDDHTLQFACGMLQDDQLPSASFLACSAASSIGPTYMKAPSGRWSHLPSHSSLKLRMVSASDVTLPGRLVNASATMNGCDKNPSMRPPPPPP